MDTYKTIRSERFELSDNEPAHNIPINKGELFFTIFASPRFTSPLAVTLIAKGKINCFPFFCEDSDHAFELEDWEKIIISQPELYLEAPVSLSVQIW